MGKGGLTALGKRLFPPGGDGCQPHHMLLATGCFLWGCIFVYGFAHFGVGIKPVYKSLGAVFLILSVALSAAYLHRHFRDRSMTYWGGGLALLLAALPLGLSLNAGGDAVCHRSTAVLMVLLFAFTGGPLLIYGLFHRVERNPREQQAPPETTQTEAGAGDSLESLVKLLLLQLAEDSRVRTDDAADEGQGLDKEELKNFTLLLTLFLSLFVFGRQLIAECWS